MISRWKVTTKDRKSLFSDRPGFQLTYPKGKIVVPPITAPGIFVFDTEDSAKQYIKGNIIDIKPRLLRVLPIGKAIKLRNYRPTHFDCDTIVLFWQNISETIKASKSSDSLAKYLGHSILSIAPLCGTLIYPAVRVMD
jgi:hypothetical protein